MKQLTDDLDTMFGLYRIPKSMKFMSAFNSYITNKENDPFWTFFNKKGWRISEKIVSYRVINHWEEKGLLVRTKDEKGKWRQYSLMDIVWIFMIRELRRWGLNLEQILNIRRTLISQYNQCEYGELEFCTALAYYKKAPVNVIIYPEENNYRGEVSTLYELINATERVGFNFLSLNINSLLQSLFPAENLKPIFEDFIEITETDYDVYNKIRDKDVNKVAIIKDKSGIPDRMEFEVTEPFNSNIHDITFKEEYQNIHITKSEGKIQSIKRTVTKKLKK